MPRIDVETDCNRWQLVYGIKLLLFFNSVKEVVYAEPFWLMLDMKNLFNSWKKH
jgi:hypothetical protein